MVTREWDCKRSHHVSTDNVTTVGEMAVGDFSGSGVVIIGRDPVKLRLISEGAALFFCHRLLSADVSWPNKPGDDETGPEAHPQDPGPKPARYQRAGPTRRTTPVGWPPRPTQYLHDPEEAKSAFIVALEENGYPPLLIEDVRRTEFTNPPRATIANTMSYTSRRDDLVDNQREGDEQTFSPDDVHRTPVGHRLQLENDVLSPLAAASKLGGGNTRIQLNALWSDIVTQSTELQLLVHRFTAAARLESQRLQATVRLGQPEVDLQWRRGLHEGRVRGHILREALSVLLGTEGGVYAEEADEETE